MRAKFYVNQVIDYGNSKTAKLKPHYKSMYEEEKRRKKVVQAAGYAAVAIAFAELVLIIIMLVR